MLSVAMETRRPEIIGCVDVHRTFFCGRHLAATWRTAADCSSTINNHTAQLCRRNSFYSIHEKYNVKMYIDVSTLSLCVHHITDSLSKNINCDFPNGNISCILCLLLLHGRSSVFLQRETVMLKLIIMLV